MAQQTINKGEIGSSVRSKLNMVFGELYTAITSSSLLTSLKTVDGAGSGLDADKLDGNEAAAFAAASHTHSAATRTIGGFVPTPGGSGTSRFLREDLSWNVPPGGGGGGGGVTEEEVIPIVEEVNAVGGNSTYWGTDGSETNPGISVSEDFKTLTSVFGSGFLNATSSGGYSSGKKKVENRVVAFTASPPNTCVLGIVNLSYTGYIGQDNNGIGLFGNGTIYKNDTSVGTVGSISANDVITMEVDIDGGTVKFAKNSGSLTSAITLPVSGPYYAASGFSGSGGVHTLVDEVDWVRAPTSGFVSFFPVTPTPGRASAIPSRIRYRTTQSAPPVNTVDYGAIADGTEHFLNERYASLAAAQVDYPAALDIDTQTIDFCALQLAGYVAFGSPGAEHGNASTINRTLHIDRGSYHLGPDTWRLRDINGGKIIGDGKRETVISGYPTRDVGNEAVIAFDGLWYTFVAWMTIANLNTGAVAALELDGNVYTRDTPLGSVATYPTRGVQGCTFQDMMIDGGGAPHAFYFGRNGTNSAQGDQCQFINLHQQNATRAVMRVVGTNILNITISGGNFQNYTTSGIWFGGSTGAVRDTAFQALSGYKQIENSGADIECTGGTRNVIDVKNIRSESLVVIKADGAQIVDIAGCKCQPASPGPWFAATNYGPAAAQYKAVLVTGSDGYKRLFARQNAGTSVSGATEPVWPLDGSTINDNGITWQEVPYNAFDLIGDEHTLNRVNTYDGGGAGKIRAPYYEARVKTSSSNYDDFLDDGRVNAILIDCTGGNRTVNLKDIEATSPTGSEFGRRVLVYKLDTSANTLTITTQTYQFSTGATVVIPGGAIGYREFLFARLTGPPRWLLIGSG